MTTLLISFVLVCLSVTGLSIGVLLGRKPIQGSCGGLSKGGFDGSCDLCGGSAARCEELNSRGD
jgi:hypothetical protein